MQTNKNRVRGNGLTKRSLSHLVLALFLLIFSSAYAHAEGDLVVPAENPETRPHYEEALPAGAVEAGQISKYFENKLPQLTQGYVDVIRIMEQLKTTLGEGARFNELLEANSISTEIPGFGLAELRVVGPYSVAARILEYQTGDVFLVYDMDNWSSNLKDIQSSVKGMRALVANNQLDSGRTDKSGLLRGRDTFIVKIDVEHSKIDSFESRPIPRFGSSKYLEAWRLSNIVSPTMGLVKIGVIMGVAQAGLTLMLSTLKAYLHGGHVEFHTALIAGALGFGISTIFDSFQNLLGRPNHDKTSPYYREPDSWKEWLISDVAQRSVKKYAFSFSVSTNLYLAADHPGSVTIFNALTISGINQFMRSFTKDAWDQMGYILKYNRETNGNIRFIGKDTGMPRQQFYSNLIQLAPTSLSVLAIFGIGTYALNVFGFAEPVQLPLFYIALGPLLQGVKLRYLEKLVKRMEGDPHSVDKLVSIRELAVSERKKWDESWGMNIKKFPEAFSDFTVRKSEELGNFMLGASRSQESLALSQALKGERLASEPRTSCSVLFKLGRD